MSPGLGLSPAYGEGAFASNTQDKGRKIQVHVIRMQSSVEDFDKFLHLLTWAGRKMLRFSSPVSTIKSAMQLLGIPSWNIQSLVTYQARWIKWTTVFVCPRQEISDHDSETRRSWQCVKARFVQLPNELSSAWLAAQSKGLTRFQIRVAYKCVERVSVHSLQSLNDCKREVTLSRWLLISGEVKDLA